LIIDDLDTKFKAIKTTAGYKTNLGNYVFAWRDLEKNPFQTSELPGLNYKDTVEHESLTFEKTLETMSVECDIGATSASIIRDCISDIEKAVATVTVSGKQINAELLSDEMNVEHLENLVFMGKAIIQIQYIVTKGNQDA
jgi:hypothetical protein